MRTLQTGYNLAIHVQKVPKIPPVYILILIHVSFVFNGNLFKYQIGTLCMTVMLALLPAHGIEFLVFCRRLDPPDMLPRDKCLQALAELRHTKWFTAQAVGSAPTSVHFFPIPDPSTTKKETEKIN
jgi:hypothetical protein